MCSLTRTCPECHHSTPIEIPTRRKKPIFAFQVSPVSSTSRSDELVFEMSPPAPGYGSATASFYHFGLPTSGNRPHLTYSFPMIPPRIAATYDSGNENPTIKLENLNTMPSSPEAPNKTQRSTEPQQAVPKIGVQKITGFSPIIPTPEITIQSSPKPKFVDPPKTALFSLPWLLPGSAGPEDEFHPVSPGALDFSSYLHERLCHRQHKRQINARRSSIQPW